MLTIAKACWVKSHLSCVFLLRSCIEFKQGGHSCGNTLLHPRRTPREKVLLSSGVTTHQLTLSLSFSVCLSFYLSLSQVWKHPSQLSQHYTLVMIIQCTHNQHGQSFYPYFCSVLEISSLIIKAKDDSFNSHSPA